MRRREFMALLGGLSAAPICATAQQPDRLYRIGFLSPISPPDINLESFRRGMRSVGYVEGRDFIVEARYAHRDYSRFPALVQELLAEKVELIVTGGASTRGAPFAAKFVPVVFGFSGNPVEIGLVTSFSRPGGNATGVSFLSLDVAEKRTELLNEIAPAIKRLAVLSNPEHPGDASEVRTTQESARKLGMEMQHFPADSDPAMHKALLAIAESKCDGLLTVPDALTLFHRQKIAAVALNRRLPSMFGWRIYAEAGGLISFGAILDQSYARLAYFVDRIFKGAKPADIPVEQPATFELVINRKTANTLGITIPSTLLARADEVIE
jgi:putative tryptophan/tyrosine transport system substrate-binding protein